MILSLDQILFVYFHVYREGNVCADRLANFGIGISGLVWWNIIPDFFFDKINYPKFRFS